MSSASATSGAASPPLQGDSRPLLGLLLAMTLVTGLVDAASYLGLGHVFAASMTGTVVLLGFSLPRAAELSPGVLLVALIAFVAGAIAGGRLAAIAAMCVGAAIGAILLRFGLAAPVHRPVRSTSRPGNAVRVPEPSCSRTSGATSVA